MPFTVHLITMADKDEATLSIRSVWSAESLQAIKDGYKNGNKRQRYLGLSLSCKSQIIKQQGIMADQEIAPFLMNREDAHFIMSCSEMLAPNHVGPFLISAVNIHNGCQVPS